MVEFDKFDELICLVFIIGTHIQHLNHSYITVLYIYFGPSFFSTRVGPTIRLIIYPKYMVKIRQNKIPCFTGEQSKGGANFDWNSTFTNY